MKEATFKDLVDIDNLKKILKANYGVSGIPVGIIDTHSGEIYAGEGWQKICTEYHRKNETLRKHCIESDTEIASKMERGKPYA